MFIFCYTHPVDYDALRRKELTKPFYRGGLHGGIMFEKNIS